MPWGGDLSKGTGGFKAESQEAGHAHGVSDSAIERHFNPNNSPQLEQYVTRILDTYSNVFFAWLDEFGVQRTLQMILNHEDRTNYLYS